MHTDSITTAVRARRAQGIRAGVVLALVIVVLRFVPTTSKFIVFPLIENLAYDLYFDYRAKADMRRYVIVAIDEDSLRPERLGQFPWKRSVYAKLLPRLSEASVVAFDVLFSEPTAEDTSFARAIGQHGRVVLAAHRRERTMQSAPTSWDGYGRVEADGIPRLAAKWEFVAPVPSLAAAARGIGYTELDPESDGVFRRAQLLLRAPGGSVYPSLGLETARIASGTDPLQLVAGPGRGVVEIGAGPVRTIPASDASVLINYAGPRGTVAVIPLWEVLAGKHKPESFRGKIVLIGATAAGLYDVRYAPFRRGNRVFFGVETNANITHTLLEAQPLADARGNLLWALYALLLSTLVVWAIWTTGETVGTIFSVGILGMLVLPAFAMGFVFLHQAIPYSPILLAVAIPMALALYGRLGAERRQVKQQFGTYVSPDVLHELAAHPDLVRIGQRRHVTLMFADVRGSTTLAEKIAPDVWIAQLNEYLSEMSEAIFAYDGYLDKFMGDGIMAIWNTFDTQPDHAELALKAGLQMVARLERLTADWEQREDRVPFKIGIGLHTGEAIIGNVGSDRRAQYTAIGDTVNAASRVEALTKDFQATLILSETTLALLGDPAQFEELGEAELKGRVEPLRIFKPKGLPGEVMGRVRQETK